MWGGEDSDIVLRGDFQGGGIRPGRIRGGVEMDQETGKAEAGMQTIEGEVVCDWRGWKPRSRRSRRGGRGRKERRKRISLSRAREGSDGTRRCGL